MTEAFETRLGPTGTAGTSYEYDAAGRVTKVTDPSGHEINTAYLTGGFKNTDSVWTGAGGTKMTYDSYGRVATRGAPNGSTVATTYDTSLPCRE